MNDVQKKDIIEINSTINYYENPSEDVVSNFDYNQSKDEGMLCKNCKLEIIQPMTGRPKKFCSDSCRRYWWKKNKHLLVKNETAIYKLRCQYCGNVFEMYGNNKRKYCCHNCYIRDRFLREEDANKFLKEILLQEGKINIPTWLQKYL